MNAKRDNKKTDRKNTLVVPMTDKEYENVVSSAKREGLTNTAYSRSVFNAVSKISLARLIVLVENEVKQ